MRKKILITGASGLLGRHLVDLLLLQPQFELFILSRKPENSWAGKNVKLLQLNLAQHWDERELPPDLFAIIHLSQGENFRDFPGSAKEVFYINTESTIRLADFAVKTKVSHFIYASSGAVYGALGTFTEDDPIAFIKKLDFYAATKLCSELLLQNYAVHLNVISLRFFFIYGKGQQQNMLLPRLVGFVKNEQPITLDGEDGLTINPVHATDAAKAVMAALTVAGSHTINVAGPQIISLKKIGEIIGKQFNKSPLFKIDQSKKSQQLIGDISLMSQLLIVPAIKPEEGIKTLI